MKAWLVTIKKDNKHTVYYSDKFTDITWLIRMDLLDRLDVEAYAINTASPKLTIHAEFLNKDVLNSLLKTTN